MSDGDSTGLSGITGPDVTPQTSADELTAKELKKARKKPDRPSPGDRHADSVDRHINDICDDRNRLREWGQSLQAELDVLRPQFAAIQESYKASLASNVFSAAMVGLGGSLISGAGYAGETWKLVILTFGVATFIWGLLLQVTSTWRAALFRPPQITRSGQPYPRSTIADSSPPPPSPG